VGERREDILSKINQLDDRPVTYDTLKSIYQASVDIVNNDVLWYQARQRRWRFATRLVKVLTYIGLAVGVIIPLLPGGNAWLPFGYVALVIAGLIFSLDQIFLFSKTWIRYIKAEMDIRKLLLAFQYQWYQDRITFGESISVQQGKAELEKFKVFMDKVHQIIQQEATTWAVELESSIAELGAQLKTDKQDVETKRQESDAQAAQVESGALQLTLANADKDKSIVISIDDAEVASGEAQTTYSFTDVKAGIRAVKITETLKSGKTSTNTYSVVIKAGEITTLKGMDGGKA